MRNPDVSCFVSVNPDWWRPAFLLCFLSALRLPFRRSEPSVSTNQLAESKIRNETQYGKLRNATSNNIKYENIQISDLQSRGFWTGFLCSVRWGRWVRTAFSAETEKTSAMSALQRKPKNIAIIWTQREINGISRFGSFPRFWSCYFDDCVLLEALGRL